MDFLRGVHVGAMSSVLQQAATDNLESFIKLRAELEVIFFCLCLKFVKVISNVHQINLMLQVVWQREKMDFIETHRHVTSLLNLHRNSCRASGRPELDKTRAYVEVVKNLNYARLDGFRFNVSCFSPFKLLTIIGNLKFDGTDGLFY